MAGDAGCAGGDAGGVGGFGDGHVGDAEFGGDGRERASLGEVLLGEPAGVDQVGLPGGGQLDPGGFGTVSLKVFPAVLVSRFRPRGSGR